MSTAEEWVNGKLKQYSDSTPQTPIDTISFILEDLAVAVELANEKTYNQELDEAKSKAMTAIYNLLERNAVEFPITTRHLEPPIVVDTVKAVPLERVKELFNLGGSEG